MQLVNRNRQTRGGKTSTMAIRPGQGPLRAGFTLIEVLIVLMIAAVVGTIAFPRASAITDDAALNQAAAAIRTDLQRVFSEAAKNRRPVRVAISTTGRRYTVTDRGTGQVIFIRDLAAEGTGYRVGTLATTVSTFDVFPTGLASSAVTLTVGLNGNSRQVVMTRVGLAQVQ